MDEQAGLFSAVSSAFIIDVQSKLEPDPNDMTAAYMRILIHAVNASLFPDAIPDPITWAGPPPGVVTVQSLLYASLATSLFAAFLAFLGKQWINRYLRHRGGSAADKSRDRQQKLDGLERWHFQLVIESLPVMLQLALLLLACALSLYLWPINQTVAGVIIAVTLLGVGSYLFFTLAATLSYSCPYQTPSSVVFRALLSRHRNTLAPLITWSIAAFRSSTKTFRRFLRSFFAGVQGAASTLGCVANSPPDIENIPLTTVTPPTRIFDDVLLDLESRKADARCIAWVLYSTTDPDTIFSTVRFAADIVWYPEIAGALSASTLMDLLSECMLDGQVVAGREEQANAIGMALASVLAIQLSVEPEREDLKELRERVIQYRNLRDPASSTFGLVVFVLVFVAQTHIPVENEEIRLPWTPLLRENLSSSFKVWFARTILQTVWRWHRIHHQNMFMNPCDMADDPRFLTDGEPVPTVFNIIWILIQATCLGVTMDIRDLYPPNNT